MGSAWVGGGGLETDAAGLLIALMGGGCEGGGGAGWGERKFVLALDAACYACSSALCLSFSYLRSAVEASFDIKKACGEAVQLSWPSFREGSGSG